MKEKYLVDGQGIYYAPQPLINKGEKFSPIEITNGEIHFDSSVLAARREQNRKMVDRLREIESLRRSERQQTPTERFLQSLRKITK